MTTQERITQKDFNKKIHVYSSNYDNNGNLVIKYAEKLFPNTLGITQTIKTYNYGGAKTSLYNYMVLGNEK